MKEQLADITIGREETAWCSLVLCEESEEIQSIGGRTHPLRLSWLQTKAAATGFPASSCAARANGQEMFCLIRITK